MHSKRKWVEDIAFRIFLLIFKVPYVNQSAVTVQDKFSLHRTYIIFRTLGLRHLTVVNNQSHVVGIITRKDLMGFSMEEKLHSKMIASLNQDETENDQQQEIVNVPI